MFLRDFQPADRSSGIDAVKDILAEFSVPVIFSTAFPERLLTGTRPEPTFLITKPFQRSTVKAAIAQALFFDAATVPAAYSGTPFHQARWPVAQSVRVDARTADTRNSDPPATDTAPDARAAPPPRAPRHSL